MDFGGSGSLGRIQEVSHEPPESFVVFFGVVVCVTPDLYDGDRLFCDDLSDLPKSVQPAKSTHATAAPANRRNVRLRQTIRTRGILDADPGSVLIATRLKCFGPIDFVLPVRNGLPPGLDGPYPAGNGEGPGSVSETGTPVEADFAAFASVSRSDCGRR